MVKVVKHPHFIDKSFVANILNYLHIFSMCIRRGGIVLMTNPKPLTLANPKRFRTIQDLTQMRPDCGASIDDIFVIDNEILLIINLSHLGGMLNPYNSPSASYIRTHGVIVASCAKNDPCPVLWSDPFLLLPMSHHFKEDFNAYADRGKVLGSVSCPSGSFLFMTKHKDMPTSLGSLMDEALKKEAGVKINIPNGTYRVFYEQFEVPERTKKELYRNIVVQKQ
jgi:hypothetical protein